MCRFKAKLARLTTDLEEEKAAAQKCRDLHEVRYAEAKRQIAELERQLRVESLEKDELREAVERETARAENFQEELGTAKRQGRRSVAPLADHACQAAPDVRSRGTQVEDTVFEYIKECTEILHEATDDSGEAASVGPRDITKDRQEKPSSAVRWIRDEGTFFSKPPEGLWQGSCLADHEKHQRQASVLLTEEEESESKEEGLRENQNKGQIVSKRETSLASGDPKLAKLLGSPERLQSDSEKEQEYIDREDTLFRKVAAVALRAKSKSLEPTACAQIAGRPVSTERRACSKEGEDSKESKGAPKSPSSVGGSSLSARTSLPSPTSASISSLFKRLKDNQRSSQQPRQSLIEGRAKSSGSEVLPDAPPLDSLRAKALETLHRARSTDQRTVISTALTSMAPNEGTLESGNESAGGGGRKAEARKPTGSSGDSSPRSNSPRRRSSVNGFNAHLFAPRGRDGDRPRLDKEEGTEQIFTATATRSTEQAQERLLAVAQEAATRRFRAKEETEILRLLQRAGEHSEADLLEADAGDVSRRSPGILARTDISLISRTLDADLRKLGERARAARYSATESRGVADRCMSAPRPSVPSQQHLPAGNGSGSHPAQLWNSHGRRGARDEVREAAAASSDTFEYSAGPVRNAGSDRAHSGGGFRQATQGLNWEPQPTMDNCRPGGAWTRATSGTYQRERLSNRDDSEKWRQVRPRSEWREDGGAEQQSRTSLFEALSATSHQISLERNAVKYGVREIVRRNKQPSTVSCPADASERMKASLAEQMKVRPHATLGGRARIDKAASYYCLLRPTS